jgi:hypothetical protein
MCPCVITTIQCGDEVMQNEERIDDDEKKRIWDEGRRSSRIDGMRIPLPSTCYWTITRLEAMEKTRLNSQE